MLRDAQLRNNVLVLGAFLTFALQKVCTTLVTCLYLVLDYVSFSESIFITRGGYLVRTHTAKTQRQRVPISMLLMGVFLVLAILLAACGSSSGSSSGTASTKSSIASPNDLI